MFYYEDFRYRSNQIKKIKLMKVDVCFLTIIFLRKNRKNYFWNCVTFWSRYDTTLNLRPMCSTNGSIPLSIWWRVRYERPIRISMTLPAGHTTVEAKASPWIVCTILREGKWNGLKSYPVYFSRWIWCLNPLIAKAAIPLEFTSG